MGGIDLAALFNAAPNPYVILDPALTIVGCNEAYLAVTARQRDDIVGLNIFDAFPSDPDSPAGRMLRNSLAKVLAEAKSDELALIPYDTSRPDEPAAVRYWSATHTPIFDAEGQVAFILQHTTDITDVERLRSGALGAQGAQEQAGFLGRVAAVQAENLVLAAQSEQLQRLFEQAPSFMAVLEGPEHRFALANAAYGQIVGHRELLGRTVAEALPEVVEQGFIQLLDNVRNSGEPFIGRGMPIMLQQEAGAAPQQAYLDFVYQPIRDVDGKVAGIFVQGHDITDQKTAEAELARQSEVLRLAQEAGGVGTFDWDFKAGVVSLSPTFAELYGFPPGTEAVPVTRFAEIVHPEDADRLATASRQLQAGVQQTEYRVITPQGVRWIGRRGSMMLDADGQPLRMVGAAYDLTDRKANETQLALLAQESAHRIKNMLAMVQAIASQTMRNAQSMPEARDAIGARLVALGQAQDLLHGDNTDAAGLRDVVLAATRLHGETASLFTVDGPNVLLSAKAVLGLGLMLHELGTNALKYGALSAPGGRVEISWVEHQGDDEHYVDWVWREVGGPPVVAPSRLGFGSRLITRGLAANLGNAVELDYGPDGVVCSARITVEG